MTEKPLTFVSLFSGCGGMDYGFVQAGFQPVYANDVSPTALWTYRGLIDTTSHQVVAGDITVPLTPRPEMRADLVIGGPPCQGFSVAGKMDVNDIRSELVYTFMDIVDDMEPRAFVMENVKSLATNRKFARIRRRLLQRADQMNYQTEIVVLNASHFGVPQARERMFMIGVKRGQGRRPVPVPTTEDSPPTLRDALAGLPPYGQPGNDTFCEAAITMAKNPVLRKSPWAGMMFNGAGRLISLDRPAPTLPASMGGNKNPIIDQHQLDNGGEPWIEDYHLSLRSGGSPLTKAPDRLRRMTQEEAAAIQTFPADMVWHGRQTDRFRQIGNAVPPTLAYHVALAVKSSLNTKGQL
jgi:DNA (cytosine-5)-methyltransferase 1